MKNTLLILTAVVIHHLGTADSMAQSTIPPIPVLPGIDNAGGFLPQSGVEDWNHEPFFQALDELGAKLVVYHFFPVSHAGEKNSELTRKRIEAIDKGMRAHSLQYMLNVEMPNFASRLEITPGVNEFEHPSGIHRWDLRMDWLNPVLPPQVVEPLAFQGIVYDECEHMLLSNNKYSGFPKDEFDQPFLVNTHGMPLEEAYEKLVTECRRIREEHYENRVRLQTEQVWPDLFHLFARAGWDIAPKLLKEGLSSVALSISLGAAVQYQETGISFSASPDLWNRAEYPGHSPEALRSALMMGYWLGAERLYVENLDYHGKEPRHPGTSPKGSLISWREGTRSESRSSIERYELTNHGLVVQDFFKNYVPAHPRYTNWREYDPRVAIIRLPDGGWGQFSEGPGHGEAASQNRLLGNREMPLDEAASEWLQVWPILTHGKAHTGAISTNNPFVYPDGVGDFFVPIDSVAVFDHLVDKQHLAHVDCLIVCGHALSATTFAAVHERVTEGSTCVISRRLFEQFTKTPLPGDWMVVEDFGSLEVASKLKPFLGTPDVARFRFRTQVVEFRHGLTPDSIEVKVTDR